MLSRTWVAVCLLTCIAVTLMGCGGGTVASPTPSPTPTPQTTAPVIMTHPASQAVALGQAATFSATASGTDPLTYQWQKNGTAISGAAASSYTTPPATISDSGAKFRVLVTNSRAARPAMKQS